MKINVGAVIDEPGSSLKNKTGTWRDKMPIIDRNICNGNGACWTFCPDNAIKMINGKAVVDYNYCKGCGICEKICPVKAIRMVNEEK